MIGSSLMYPDIWGCCIVGGIFPPNTPYWSRVMINLSYVFCIHGMQPFSELVVHFMGSTGSRVDEMNNFLRCVLPSTQVWKLNVPWQSYAICEWCWKTSHLYSNDTLFKVEIPNLTQKSSVHLMQHRIWPVNLVAYSMQLRVFKTPWYQHFELEALSELR